MVAKSTVCSKVVDLWVIIILVVVFIPIIGVNIIDRIRNAEGIDHVWR